MGAGGGGGVGFGGESAQLLCLQLSTKQFSFGHACKTVCVCVQAKAGITDDIIEVLTATSAELSKGRRKRPMPPGLAAPGSFDHYKLLSSHPLHKTSEVSTHSNVAADMIIST